MIQTNDHRSKLALTVTRSVMLSVVLCSGLVTGCTLCDTSDDLAFPSYGGLWERTNRFEGRVGSVFDPAGARSSQLADRDEPVTQDEIERQRRQNEESQNGTADPDASGSPEDGSGADDGPGFGDESNDDADQKADDLRDAPNLDEDPEYEKKKQDLRNQEMEDIKVIPGNPIPPLLR